MSSSSRYTVFHKDEPWTGVRPTTKHIIVHVRNKPHVTTARELDTDFRRKGFLCCGYHYVLTGAGVSVMRHPASIGAGHPDFDETAVYVAILNYDGKTPVPQQLEGPLVSLLNDLSSQYPDADIISAPSLMKLEGYQPFNDFIGERHARRRPSTNK